MSSSTSNQPSSEWQEKEDRAVLCAKCERLNKWGQNECSRCGARLYIACSDCGHKNERVRSRCTSCNRRLHFSRLERIVRHIRGRAVELTGLQVVIFCVGVLLAFILIILFSTVNLPSVF